MGLFDFQVLATWTIFQDSVLLSPYQNTSDDATKKRSLSNVKPPRPPGRRFCLAAVLRSQERKMAILG
jgi:hypothetical protein